MLAVPRYAQPDDVSCGPTCLAQVMAYYGDPHPIAEIRQGLRVNPDGGTLAVHLAARALDMGYRARLYPFGVRVFDPTWWELGEDELRERLALRMSALAARGASLTELAIVQSYIEVLDRGGSIAFHEPSPQFLARILANGRPLVVGLNSTWLYRAKRERPEDNEPDDIAGKGVGHFVVVNGYTGSGLHLHVRDPSEDAPEHLHVDGKGKGIYPVPGDRLVHAILLGDLTRDAVVLEMWPARRHPPDGAHDGNGHETPSPSTPPPPLRS